MPELCQKQCFNKMKTEIVTIKILKQNQSETLTS